jgi:hypothetical protein
MDHDNETLFGADRAIASDRPVHNTTGATGVPIAAQKETGGPKARRLLHFLQSLHVLDGVSYSPSSLNM